MQQLNVQVHSGLQVLLREVELPLGEGQQLLDPKFLGRDLHYVLPLLLLQESVNALAPVIEYRGIFHEERSVNSNSLEP